MKKTLKFILVFLLLGLGGCSKEISEDYIADVGHNLKSVTCAYEQNDISYISHASIDIYSDGEFVTRLVSKETFTSDDQSILDYIENTYKNLYDSMNKKFKGYDYTITNKNGKVVCDLKIDYTNMNLDSYVLESDGLTKFFVNGKIQTEGIIEMYESLGASCK